jgi:hypothetical protein
MNKLFLTALTALLLAAPSLSWGFSFSEADNRERNENAAKAQQIMAQLSTPCRQSIAGQTIAVLIGERHSGGLSSNQGGYGVLFETLNNRLQAVGLRTVTQAQITAAIAQAEIQAVLNNNPDAAIAASSRIGANFFLNGIISSRANRAMSMNVKGAQMNVNEVAVTITLSLTDSSGRVISSLQATEQSWAGADTLGVAQSIVDQQAAGLVAQLYSDFCRRAGK